MLKRFFLIFLILLVMSFPISLVGLPVSGECLLSIRKVLGDVKVKLPGENWKVAAEGMLLPQASSINTGKGSFAIMGYKKVVLNLMPMTMITIAELLEGPDLLKTTLTMKSGKLGASVKTLDRKNNLTVNTPISTASVRGTEIVFDGYVLEVYSGVVDFVNSYNIKVAVVAGGKVVSNGEAAAPASAATVAMAEAEVSVIPDSNLEAAALAAVSVSPGAATSVSAPPVVAGGLEEEDVFFTVNAE
jgi:hypothetical protein